MALKNLLRRRQIRLSSYLFSHTIGRSIEFGQEPPSILGKWPIVSNKGKLIIGTDSYIRSFRVRPSLTVLKDARLEFGFNAFINDGVNICASTSIVIGHSAKIGDMTNIFDTDFHETTPQKKTRKRPIQLGDNVWIGANSMILAGARIGSHSVIAAGSIVTGEIPPKCIAAGTPARVISVFEAEDDWIRQ
jgi:acetyltransferase-like isoleucine patch superfamily enzyme